MSFIDAAREKLADLGRRIDLCIASHGFTERELLNRHIKRSIAQSGTARIYMTIGLSADGKWSASEWRSA